MTTDTLHPCPFCGSNMIVDSYIRDGRQMACTGCHASVHVFNGKTDTMERLRNAWNRRVDNGYEAANLSSVIYKRISPWCDPRFAIEITQRIEDSLNGEGID